MALIKCPECGQMVSDRASTCIHCGYPISQYTEAAWQNLMRDILKSSTLKSKSGYTVIFKDNIAVRRGGNGFVTGVAHIHNNSFITVDEADWSTTGGYVIKNAFEPNKVIIDFSGCTYDGFDKQVDEFYRTDVTPAGVSANGPMPI